MGELTIYTCGQGDPTSWRGKDLHGMTREELLAAFFDLHQQYARLLASNYYKTEASRNEPLAADGQPGRALYAFWPPTEPSSASAEECEIPVTAGDQGET